VSCPRCHTPTESDQTYCSGSCFWAAYREATPKTGIRRAKSGKRKDLGGLHVRSAWEANYARYLNWLLVHGQIGGWAYEPQLFIFYGIRRGVRAYLPDFKVLLNDGSFEFHEIKGYMDAKSKLKLKRMAKY
jgi:hypothetical protein